MALRTKHCFFLKDGRTLCNITELIVALKEMSDKEFSRHGNKNDFAAWLGDVLAMKALAKKIQGKSREETIAILEKGFVYETLIIGAGFSGITVAIYASRKRMNYLVLSGDIGGQIAVSGEIGNYPGFAQTNYLEFQKNLNKQLAHNHVHIKQGTMVKSVTKKDNVFTIETDTGTYKSYTLIMAQGARARTLNVPGEDEYAKRGVSYCAICDGPLFTNKTVAVIGGGNSALEAVDFMINIADKTYMIVLGPELKGHQALIDNVKGQKKVEIIYNARTTEIFGDGKKVTGLKYDQKGKVHELGLEGIFIEIGRIPNTEIVKSFVELDRDGHIVVNKHSETNVPGCYAAGDVSDVHEYQFIIAGGMGCMALLRAANYLAKLPVKLKAHATQAP